MRALLGLVALVAAPGLGRAEEIPRLFVVWEAPAGCPDRDAFVRLVAGHLHGVAPPSPMHVEVVVTPAGRELALTLQTQTGDGGGERVLRGRDCALLAETAALTLALAIAPGAVEAADGGAPERFGDDERPPGGRRDGAAPAATVTREGREWGIPLAARAGVAGEVGGLPGLSPGFGLTVATRLGRWWRIEGNGSYWLQKSATAETAPAIGVELSSIAGGVRLCVDPLGRRVVLGFCAGAELIRTRGVATGVADPEPNSWVWFSALGGPSLAWNLSRSFLLRLDVEAVGRPFQRPRFAVTEPDEVELHKPAWVGVRGGVGLEAHFP